MTRWVSLSLLVLGTVLVAAGSASAQRLAPPPPESSWPRFVCEEGRCPEGVGALVVFHDDGEVGFCTATLVARDRVVTAAHCLPAGPHVTPFFFLPDEHAVTVTLRAVVGVVHRAAPEPGGDHAILELDRGIAAPFATLARTELRPDSTLTIVRASPHEDRRVFVRRERCVVMPRALTGSDAPTASVVRVGGCTIVAGNSGAPVLDARGRVVAVVSAGLAPPTVAEILAPWLAGPAPFVGTISTLACVPRGLAPGARPPICGRLRRDPSADVLSSEPPHDAALDAQRLALAERLVEWAREGEQALGWELRRHVEGERTIAVPVPACVHRAALGARVDRRGRFAISVEVPAWEALAFLGSGLRMVPITQPIGRVRIELHGALAADTGAEVELRAVGELAPALPPRATLPPCD